MSAAGNRRPHVLFAGGGTGGHVFPALAVAEELGRRGWRLSFAGSARGPEKRWVSDRGLPFEALASRPLVGKGPAAKARALWILAGSAFSARKLMVEREIDAVVGTGGYVSAPVVVGAALARRPRLLLEPNAGAGAANRWLSRLASGAVVAYEPTRSEMRCPTWVTGVPVRTTFHRVPPPTAEGPPRLLLLGGSQGARQLNLTLPPALGLAEKSLPGLKVLHQAGVGKVEETREAYASAGLEPTQVEVVAFIDDPAAALADCHLVVSRAGAITTAEICATGRASVLVPLALAGGHQGANARLLVDAGAARMLPAETLDAEKLAITLVEILSERRAAVEAGRSARTLARPDAAAAVADRLEALLTDGAGGGAG